MAIRLGSVFWKDDANGGHFYVVITPPAFPEILVVNFTTQEPRKDQSCVIQPGEHPAIVDESVVSFDHAEVVPTNEVQRLHDEGTFVPKADASKELLLRIWDGAYRTNRMPVRCVELLSRTIPN